MQANLMETAAENDEVLLDKYFESGELTREETIHGIRLGIASVNTIPVMAGSALQNRGVINLLNEIVAYMPQANERTNTLATDLAADKVVNIQPDPAAPLAAPRCQDGHRPLFGKAQLSQGVPRRAQKRQHGMELPTRKGRSESVRYMSCAAKRRSPSPNFRRATSAR